MQESNGHKVVALWKGKVVWLAVFEILTIIKHTTRQSLWMSASNCQNDPAI